MRLKLLATDVKKALLMWWLETKEFFMILGYALGIVTGILYIILLVATNIEQTGHDDLRSILVRCYWWIPLSLLISATAIAIPYDDLIRSIKKKQRNTSETLTWWYVKYIMPVSKAPLYINHQDDRIRAYSKELLKGSHK